MTGWTLRVVSHVSASVACLAVLIAMIEGLVPAPDKPLWLIKCAILAALLMFWAVPIWFVSTILLVVKGSPLWPPRNPQ